MTSPWRRPEYRPKHAAEKSLNKIHHKYWYAFVGHLYILIPKYLVLQTSRPSFSLIILWFSSLLSSREITYTYTLFVLGAITPQYARTSSFTTFLDHTQRRTTVSKTPPYEWSVRRRHLYLTTNTKPTTDKRQCPRRDSNPLSQQASGRRPTS